MIQSMFSVRVDGSQVVAEWPAWSRAGVRELLGEFELGCDAPQWGEVWESLEWVRFIELEDDDE